MSIKSDSRLAEFLRRVVAGGNDVAPAVAVFGQDVDTEVQRSMATQFAATVHEMGHIEPVAGDLQRIRVTRQGQDWLDDYDANRPSLHPRFSS